MIKYRKYVDKLLWMAAACWMAAAGCTDSQTGPPTGAPGVLADLVIVEGNNQKGQAGQSLEQPLVVRAIDGHGNPVSGIVVHFTVSQGLGVVAPASDTTGNNGLARSQLTFGGIGGVVKVSASTDELDGLTPNFTASAEAGDTDGPIVFAPTDRADLSHFSLAVEKLNMPGKVRFGLDNRITAFVFDAESNPVPAGTEVRFRTTGGGIGEVALTDAAGRASVQLLSAEPIPADGLVTISAETVGEDDSVLTTQTQVLFSGPTEIRLIQPVNFSIEPGEAKTFVFYVGDPSGNPLAPGTVINVNASGGSVTGQTVVEMQDVQSTDATRYAVLFTAGTGDESAEMTIDVRSPNGDRRVNFVSGSKGVEERVADLDPVSIELDSADSLLIGDGTSTTVVTATVRDQDGNGVPNLSVFFRSSTGSIDATGQTDGAGRASAVYRSSVNPAGVPRVEITAETGQLSALAALRLLGVRLALNAAETVLAADGISQTAISAVLTTENGNPVPFVAVNFGASLGTLSSVEGQTDVNGQAVVTYTGVESPADLDNVKIRATASGLDTDIDLQLRGVILQVVSNADTIIADGNAQALIQIDLRRTDGVPVANGVLAVRTNIGTLSSELIETDSKGSGQVILVSGTDAGKATVGVRYGLGLEVETEVAFVKGPPASIVLRQVDPPSISVKGSGAEATAIVTFQILDERGNPVADGEEVVFSLDPPFSAEETVGPERTATVNGLVYAAVNSGTVARTVRLIAEAVVGEGKVVRSTPVPIAIHGGLPDLEHFSIAAKPVNLAGRVLFGLESTITSYVFDKYSNPVPAGTSVRYSTDGGGIQGSVGTNDDGQGNVLLFTAEPVPLGPDFLAQITGQTVDENGNEIEALTTVLFSGPTAPIELTGAGADSVRAGRLFISDGGFQIITFTISDDVGKPIMGGSSILVNSDVAGVSGDSRIIVPDARSGHTNYAVILIDPDPLETPPRPPERGTVLMQVESLNGNRQLSFAVIVD